MAQAPPSYSAVAPDAAGPAVPRKGEPVAWLIGIAEWTPKRRASYDAAATTPRDSGRQDYVGGFALTTGDGADDLCRQFDSQHDDMNSIMTKALADRLAEAFAEYLHERVRGEWGHGNEPPLNSEQLIAEEYRGIRPAHGYPACPDHTEKGKLFDILEATGHTGVTLTESFAMYPAASISGLYFAHPESRYFAVDRISRDQVLDYARRKGMSVAEMERWLAPNL